jgi:hypothetical protein
MSKYISKKKNLLTGQHGAAPAPSANRTRRVTHAVKHAGFEAVQMPQCDSMSTWDGVEPLAVPFQILTTQRWQCCSPMLPG